MPPSKITLYNLTSVQSKWVMYGELLLFKSTEANIFRHHEIVINFPFDPVDILFSGNRKMKEHSKRIHDMKVFGSRHHIERTFISVYANTRATNGGAPALVPPLCLWSGYRSRQNIPNVQKIKSTVGGWCWRHQRRHHNWNWSWRNVCSKVPTEQQKTLGRTSNECECMWSLKRK